MLLPAALHTFSIPPFPKRKSQATTGSCNHKSIGDLYLEPLSLLSSAVLWLHVLCVCVPRRRPLPPLSMMDETNQQRDPRLMLELMLRGAAHAALSLFLMERCVTLPTVKGKAAMCVLRAAAGRLITPCMTQTRPPRKWRRRRRRG